MARLGDVCTRITDGSHNPPSGVTHSEYLMLSSKNVTDDEITTESPRFLSKAEFELENRRTQVQHGDLLMTIVGTVGRVAVVPEELQGICLQRSVAVLKPKHELITPRYLMYQLQSMQSFLEQEAHGVAQKGIYLKQVEQLDIRVLEIAEQQRIVEHLDKVSALISLRKQQIAKLDELVKARFVEMFGDPDTNPMHWQESTLSDHLNVIGGYAFKSEGFTETGIPVLRIGNINSGHFLPVNMVYWPEDQSLQRYKMYPGDLVMSLTGTVGKDDYGNVCILGNDYNEYYLNQRNAKLHLKQTLNKNYLAEMLRFHEIKSRLTGINRGVRQANISNKDILSLLVPIPPIEHQNQFAAFVAQTDRQKLTIQQSLDKLELMKKALMQKYFG